MKTLAVIGAFWAAVAEIAPLFILILKNKMEKEKELKDAKDELNKEWNEALASRDKSRIVAILQRVRESKG